MSTNHSYSQDIVGRISLISAAIAVVAAFAVVLLPMLVPAWISWSITLGSGLIAVFGAIAGVGMRLTSFVVH